MTRLLVSVRNVEEARAALEGGAHIIDVKEPSNGSLGACSVQTIREILSYVAGRVPVSAACGELRNVDVDDFQTFPNELDFAKIGLAGCQPGGGEDDVWMNKLTTFWNELNRCVPNVQRVAVSYADCFESKSPPAAEVVRAGALLRCRYFLLDTSAKQRSIFQVHSPQAIADWFRLANAQGMQAVLAGSLSLESLQVAVDVCKPDVVAVRGAVCDGARTGNVNVAKVRALCSRLQELDGILAAS